MTLHYQDEVVALHHGDCLDVLRELPDASVDAVVTDPPYGLAEHTPAVVAKAFAAWISGDRTHVPDGRGFMGKDWDGFVPPPAVFDECLRVLKPGGHLLCFAGSRTHDLMTTSIRFAGFEIRDSIAWLYGSGFPKSLDVSKAIDKAAGVERERQAPQRRARPSDSIHASGFGADGWAPTVPDPVTEAAERWQGWGTALKPAFEPIVVARKPLAGTVAANVLEHGTGALNIDACRIGTGEESQGARPAHEATAAARYAQSGAVNLAATPGPRGGSPDGRWPANVVFDEHQAAVLDDQAPDTGGAGRASGPTLRGETDATVAYGARKGWHGDPAFYGDTGGASRFFYVAKAGSDERPRVDGIAHPTVKPIDLMRWLVRLVTPPDGVVLEPFAGSGTTVEAALLEGFGCIAVEREAEYLPLIETRIARRRDPVRAVQLAGDDAGLFGLFEEHV